MDRKKLIIVTLLIMLVFLLVCYIGKFLLDLQQEEINIISYECTHYGGQFILIDPGNLFFPDDREYICIWRDIHKMEVTY